MAQAEADQARALAVRAEEQVATSRETEIAERQKAIELVEASKQAEREAIGITVAAEAEKQAAVDKAEALRTIANGEGDKVLIAAKSESDAEIVRVEAAQKRYSVEAEGKRALHEAENILSPGMIAMQIKMAIIENLDKIIRESVKPLEAIDGIKIIQVDGLTGSGNGGGPADSSGKNLADQLVNSALRYRSQAPLVDNLLEELGLRGGDIHGLTEALRPQEKTSRSKSSAGPRTGTGKARSISLSPGNRTTGR